MTNFSLVDSLPDCPEPKCVRKAHAPEQGLHVDDAGRVWSTYTLRVNPDFHEE